MNISQRLLCAPNHSRTESASRRYQVPPSGAVHDMANTEDCMSNTLQNLVVRLSEPAVVNTSVIPWSCPVPSFGDLSTAVVATLGLNPSNKEFVDEDGNELDGERRRLHTLQSLGLQKWSQVKTGHLEQIAFCCANYFHANPYFGWFGGLDDLLADTGFSYRNGSVCHLDLIPYATTCKWTNLKSRERDNLLEVVGDTLGLLLRESGIKLLVLNGQTVVSNLQKVCSVTFEKREMDKWALPRKSGTGVAGFAYRGRINNVLGVDLRHPVDVVGYNHNIQSSFGVTSAVKRAIRKWLTKAAGEVFDEGSRQENIPAIRCSPSLISCV